MDKSQVYCASVRNQAQKANHYIIPNRCHSFKGKIIKREQVGGCQWLGKEGETDYKEAWENFFV